MLGACVNRMHYVRMDCLCCIVVPEHKWQGSEAGISYVCVAGLELEGTATSAGDTLLNVHLSIGDCFCASLQELEAEDPVLVSLVQQCVSGTQCSVYPPSSQYGLRIFFICFAIFGRWSSRH